MSIQEVFIPIQLPGLNEIILASSYTRKFRSPSGKLITISRYTDLKKKTQERISPFIKISKLSPVILADLEITWIEPNRKRDPDNISVGLKFILDGLVMFKVLKTDGWRHINNISHKFMVDKKNYGVIVKLTDFKIRDI